MWRYRRNGVKSLEPEWPQWEGMLPLYMGTGLVSTFESLHVLSDQLLDQRLDAEQDQTFLWAHRNLFWQLSRDRSLHGLGMSHAMIASFIKSSFRAPWKVGDGVVGRENARWTAPKSGHPCSCQNCSQGPPVENTRRGSLLNRP